MRYLTESDLGFSLDGESNSEMFQENTAKIQKRIEAQIQKVYNTPTYVSRIGANNSIIISKSNILQ
jgi:hypothetical protein